MNQKASKLIFLCLIIMFLVLSISVIAIADDYVPDYTWGDLNGDEIADSTDLVILRKYIVGEEDIIYSREANVHDDNIINSQDYIVFRRFLIRESTEFGVSINIKDADTGEIIEDVVMLEKLYYKEDIFFYKGSSDLSGGRNPYGTATFTPIKQGYVFEPSSIQVSSSNNSDVVFLGRKDIEENKIIEFADPDFEQAIREKVNIPTGNIYQRDIFDIEELDLSNKNISSIEGIQNLINLTKLSLPYNQIRDLSPLSEMTDLVSLNLRGNGIRYISPLEYLLKLNELILGENNIDDISVLNNLHGVDVLELDHNRIEDVKPLHKISHKILDLSNNKIKEVTRGFLRAERIQELYLDNNQISDLEIFDIVEGVNPYPYLKILSLNNNEIQYFGYLDRLEGLEYLGLAGNEITDISEVEHDFENLESFDIYDNKLDISEGSETMTIINDLIDNGCDVSYKPQN